MVTAIEKDSVQALRDIPGVVHIHALEDKWEVTVENAEVSAIIPQKLAGVPVDVRVIGQEKPKRDPNEIKKERLFVLLDNAKKAQSNFEFDLEIELIQAQAEGYRQALTNRERHYEHLIASLENILTSE